MDRRTHLQVYLDNKGVIDYLNQSNITKGLKDHLAAETDVNVLERQILRDTNVEFHWEWVKGHQDDSDNITELPLDARLNIEADALAATGHGLQRQQ